MRIGIDCRMFKSSFTGIGRYTFELVKNLEKLSAQTSANIQVSADAPTKAETIVNVNNLAAKNEYVLFLNEPEFSNFEPTATNFTKVLVDAPHYSLKEQTKFLKILNEQNLDLMHFTHFNAPIRYRKPFIVTIHDLTHTLFPGRKMTSLPYRLAYRAVVKNAVRKAKIVIAVSNNTKEDLIKILKVPEEKIKVIYEGANEEFRQLTDAEKETSAKILNEKYGIAQPFFLYTGVHRYHKNLTRLIKAFKFISNKYPDLKLVITGKPDPLYPEAEQEVADQNLEEKVVFTGLITENELIALYNLAEIYIFPSLYEGFGLPILEAFACGAPVCASNISSIPEVAGKDNAIFFNPYEEKDIAEKTLSIFENSARRNKLIQNGLIRIKNFSWKKMAKEILEVYNTTSN